MPAYLLILYNFILWLICYRLLVSKYNVCSSNVLCGQNDNPYYKRVFLLFLAYSLFTFFGGDKTRYQEFVEGGYQDAAYYDFYKFEPLYVYLASISFGKVVIWKFYVYGLALVITFFTLKRLKLDHFESLLAFTIFCLVSYGSTRALLAYSIYMFGVSFLKEEKVIPKCIGFIIIVLSYFAHTSMVLPILLSSAYFVKLTKFRLLLLAILFPFLILVVNSLPNYIMMGNFDYASQAVYKFEAYTTVEEHERSYGSILTLGYEILSYLVLLPPLFYCVREEIRSKFTSIESFLVKVPFLLTYLAFVIKFSEFPTAGVVFSRYFMMAPFFMYPVIFPILKGSSKGKKIIRYIIMMGGARICYFFLMNMYYESFK